MIKSVRETLWDFAVGEKLEQFDKLAVRFIRGEWDPSIFGTEKQKWITQKRVSYNQTKHVYFTYERRFYTIHSIKAFHAPIYFLLGSK